MLKADGLINNQIKIDNKWHIARPIKLSWYMRLQDAIKVFKGKAEAVEFYKQ